MKISNNAPSRYVAVGALAVLVLITSSGSAPSVRAGSAKAEGSAAAKNSAGNYTTVSAPQTSASTSIAPLETELITITRHGFEPGEITRPAGRFLLMLDNHSDRAVLLLQLKREDGQVVKEARLKREDSDWNAIVDPPPGRYLLTEANHPHWSCVITITQ